MSDSEDYRPMRAWALNFRKYRWLNVFLPLMTPFALILIFLAGYITFGIMALGVAVLAWFDLSVNSKRSWGLMVWRFVSIPLALWGVWMIVLQFVPSLR